jgi:predicted amidophosphoribosyltransferase
MKCNFCKNEIEANMRFCPYCGNAIDHETPLDKYIDNDSNDSGKPANKYDNFLNLMNALKTRKNLKVKK